MNNIKHKLTLDRPVTYQIKVPDVLDRGRLGCDEDLISKVESNDNDLSTTTITVTVDQAALQGLLRRLYSLGLPLISVICVDFN
jgi:hypothetical protein